MSEHTCYTTLDTQYDVMFVVFAHNIVLGLVALIIFLVYHEKYRNMERLVSRRLQIEIVNRAREQVDAYLRNMRGEMSDLAREL